MVMNSEKLDSKLNQLFSRLAMEKKKIFVAAVLVLLMMFMWIRLLSGKGPQSAQASVPTGDSASTNSSSVGNNVKFFELPYVEGRHDVLARDFFRMESDVFGSGSDVSIIATQGGSEIQELARRLRLDAISMGSRPQAFINDKLVEKGDVLIIGEGSKVYECKIVSIEENKVIVKYETSEIELNLKQPDDRANVFED